MAASMSLSGFKAFADKGRMILLVAAVAATAVTFGITGAAMLRAKFAEDRATSRMFSVTESVSRLASLSSMVINNLVREAMQGGAVPATVIRQDEDRVDDLLTGLGELAEGPEQTRLYEEVVAARVLFRQAENQALAMMEAGDVEAAAAYMRTPGYFTVATAAWASTDALSSAIQQGTRESYARSRSAEIQTLIVAGASLLVITVLWGAILVDWVRQTHSARRAQTSLANMNDELERRVLERTRQLDESRERAEAANKAKSEFLAAMSHELRTPLNGVLGMATVLARTTLSETQKGMLQVIETSGRSLLVLMNDVLDFARLESGRLELAAEPFALDEVLTRAVAAHQKDAALKGLEIDLTLSDSADAVFIGDEARLRQLVSNLVSNAVKFTDKGGVRVSADYRDARMRIAVADTGCGIAPDVLARIFERFSQGDNSTRRRHGGAGLGLALARELVTAMEGEIGVTSEPGKGSEFWVELPLRGWDRAQPDVDVRAA